MKTRIRSRKKVEKQNNNHAKKIKMEVKQSNIDKLTLVIIGLFLVVVVILLYLGSVVLKIGILLPSINLFGNKTPVISSDVLILTSPVFNIEGNVDKVNGKVILVNKEISSGKSKIFTVNTTDKTTISMSPVTIPYLFKKTTSTNGRAMSLSEIQPGDYVSVLTTSDLRIMSTGGITATSINVSKVVSAISGKIFSINNNQIRIHMTASSRATSNNVFPLGVYPNSPDIRDIVVVINQDTEISTTISGKASESAVNSKLSIADLKNDMNVTVFTEGDLNSNSSRYNALLISVQSPSPTTATLGNSPAIITSPIVTPTIVNSAIP